MGALLARNFGIFKPESNESSSVLHGRYIRFAQTIIPESGRVAAERQWGREPYEGVTCLNRFFAQKSPR